MVVAVRMTVSHSTASSGSVTSPHLTSGQSGAEGVKLGGKSTADKIRTVRAQEVEEEEEEEEEPLVSVGGL